MTDDHPTARAPDDLGLPDADPDQLPPLIRPAVDRIARIRTTIHRKLLAGFMIIAVLLLAMGITSILVIRQMNERAHDQIELSDQRDLARQAIYAVTSQSHYRAMALTTFDDSWNAKIEIAKNSFTEDLDGIDAIGGPGVSESVERMREIDGGTRQPARRCCRCIRRASSTARWICTCRPSTRSRTRSRTS